MANGEIQESPQPVKRAPDRKAKPKAKPKVRAEVKHDELEGINENECPFECRMDRCVITRRGRCGHPAKGGIEPIDSIKADTVERYNNARKAIMHQRVDKRKI